MKPEMRGLEDAANGWLGALAQEPAKSHNGHRPMLRPTAADAVALAFPDARPVVGRVQLNLA